MRPRLWLAALLLWPAAAHADPISALVFLAPIIGGAAAAFIVTNAVYIFYAAVAVYGLNRQNAAKRRARAAYNDSLRDRLQMADLLPDAPRSIVLGRVRTVEGIRRRWTSGANSEKLTLIISFAGHQIDAFEQFYWADQPLTRDGSGNVSTAPFGRTTAVPKSLEVTLNGSGGGVFALPSLPTGTVWAVFSFGTGLDYTETPLTVSVSGSNVTLSGGMPSAPAIIQWDTTQITSYLRIRTYTGTASQNVGADLDSEYPGKITATDKFAGIALAVVDLYYDPDIFPQGLQAITAVIRGAKVYDPRLDSTNGGSGSQRLATPSTWTWSQNPALHAYHYARDANGWAVPAAEIRTTDVIAAATACDISTGFTLRKADGSTSTVTLPRHQSGIVIPTDADPQAMMGEIMEAMAGRNGWAGGTWRMRAGTMPASVFNLDPSWIAQRVDSGGNPDGGSVVRISNGVQRDAKVNRVTGSCVDRDQRYQALPFPAREDAVLIAAEGSFPLEVEYQAVTHVAHAQHLATIAIRESQAALRMEATCNLSAYRCELFDVGAVTLPRYGMAAKTFEVVGWRWHPAEGVKLNLAEITSAIFTPAAELVGRDPAPDSSLPSPWLVESVTGLAVTSGTTAVVDGSIITRTSLTWNAVVSQAIRSGGRIEVQYIPAGAVLPVGDWPSWVEQGDSEAAVIPGLLSRNYYFRVRAVNSLGVRGAWSAKVLHYVAVTRAAVVYRQTTAPSGAINGDVWYDTDDGNHQYVRYLGAWVSVRDATIAAALAAAVDAADAAALAQATADGKIATFYQTTAPAGGVSSVGDLWFDTNDGFKQYRYSGSAWVIAADTRIGDAINDAATAQATADGKVVTFVQTSAPTADGVGDLWLDSNDGNRLYRWSGSAWVALPMGTGGLASGAATDVVADEIDFAGAGSGSGTIVQRSFTYTPNAACIIEWTCEIEAENVVPDSGNRLYWRVTPAGGSALSLTSFTTTKRAGVASFSAAANVLLTFELESQKPVFNPSITLGVSYARVTAIKR